MDVTVVGAGVIGLSTARLLEERGHRVRVVASATGDATTSAVAGAVWFPYRCGPPDKVPDWGRRTRAYLLGLAAVREAGVDPLTGYEITAPESGGELPYWGEGLALERVPAPVADHALAWRYPSLRVEPALHLAWLERGLRHPIEHRAVIDLAAEPGDVVIDCAGLGARELTADEQLTPLLGQVVITEPGDVDLTTTITDERDPDNIFYVIPRRHELVLGGCSLPWPPGAPPVVQPEITARILDHAQRLGLRVGRVLRERAGLRPFRPSVRLERVGRIIHNYGHGGAGFTLGRATAEDAAALSTAYLITPAK